MFVYYVTLFVVGLMCLIAQSNDYVDCDTKKIYHTQQSKFFFFIGASILICVAGLRYQVGADFMGYYMGYIGFAEDFFNSLKTFNEPGFRAVCWLIVKFGGDGAVVIFTSSFITIGLFLLTIYKNTNRIFMTTMLFVFLGCWHGSFNGVRQYMAASILFCGVGFLKEKNFWGYLLIVILATAFHSSAIVMISIYFFVNRPINFKNIFFLIIACTVILLSFDKVFALSQIVLSSDYSADYSYVVNSVNILRVLVAVVPSLFFMTVLRGRGMSETDTFFMNLLLINTVVVVATSNSTFLARMGVYTEAFTALSIPKMIRKLRPTDQTLMEAIILGAYFLFWNHEISISSSLNNFHFIWQCIQ